MEPKTCGSCKHWHQQPRDARNLGAPRQGECRERLAASALVQATPAGPQLLGWATGYPLTAANFPACGQHAALIELGSAEDRG